MPAGDATRLSGRLVLMAKHCLLVPSKKAPSNITRPLMMLCCAG